MTGGKRVGRVLARMGKGGKDVRIGFFRTARYPDGTSVALVAASNEFGIEDGIPERPFFRNAVRKSEDNVLKILKNSIAPEKMVMDTRTANLIGAYMVSEIQSEIQSLRKPPNSPVTIKAKGSSNPLIDTGKMRQSVSWEVK